jgi:hypothetical protein
MPELTWSSGALAVLRNKRERDAMARLFDAYFRVSGQKSHEALRSSILHLDLPIESYAIARLPALRGPASPLGQPDKNRYHFYAKFTKQTGWVVHTALKVEHRILSKGPGV